MFNPPTKIKIDVSPGKGLGVFATEKIYKEETIEEWCENLPEDIEEVQSDFDDEFEDEIPF